VPSADAGVVGLIKVRVVAVMMGKSRASACKLGFEGEGLVQGESRPSRSDNRCQELGRVCRR
jgi:hypothetical protein